MGLLFISPTLTSPISSKIRRAVRLRRMGRATASATPPSRSGALITAANLAQTARVIMSVIQMSSLVNPAFLKPLYTPQIHHILFSNLSLVQALGMANLSTVVVLHSRRSFAYPCHLANIVAFATTALVYSFNPVKPIYVNLPFVITLALIALLNAFSLARVFRPAESIRFGFVPIAKLTAAAVILFAALTSAEMFSRVYLLQIALNLAVSAGTALYRQPVRTEFSLADSAALFGVAVCLFSRGTPGSAFVVAVAALSTGSEIFARADT